MATTNSKLQGPIVLVGQQNGITVISSGSPLSRLNYFDGKFLRASDLKAEQDYLRKLVQLTNQAGGHGVANGFSVSVDTSGALNISQGLAIDANGRIILLPAAVAVSFDELIEKSKGLATAAAARAGQAGSGFGDCVAVSSEPASTVISTSDLFVITVAAAEALCGEEDVYGKLCEDACVTSTDRPYRVEGIVLRARPIALLTPLPLSSAVALDQTHLRSRLASAYFESERFIVGGLISKSGLDSTVWCFGTPGEAAAEVAIGVFARSGNNILFLDAWISRRERVDTPAKRYWQWRMSMRPWDVYLAQILQFQCQLRDSLATPGGPSGPGDPCQETKALLTEASKTIDEIRSFYSAVASRLADINAVTLPGGLSGLSTINTRLLKAARLISIVPQDRRLIRSGIIELPSAGYLPIAPSSTVTVNKQVRELMGEGVDLRFCVVRPDYVPHALEEAQHMERISLTEGIDNPNNKPRVDILVPKGEILERASTTPGMGFEARAQIAAGRAGDFTMHGAARATVLGSGGGALYLGAAGQVKDPATVDRFVGSISRLGAATDPAPAAALWIEAVCTVDPFSMQPTQKTAVELRFISVLHSGQKTFVDILNRGDFLFQQISSLPGGGRRVQGTIRALDRTRGRAGDISVEEEHFSWTGRVILDRLPIDNDGVRYSLTIEEPTNKNWVLAVDTLLTASPIRAETKVTYQAKIGLTQQQPFAGISLSQSIVTENADVFQASNGFHAATLSGLEIIGAVLDADNFADSSSVLLFPAAQPSSGELEVRATEDWVLFHRRRDETCAQDRPVAPVPPRRYQVFHALVTSLQAAETLRKALQNNDGAVIQRMGVHAVDIVEFAPGVAALTTPLDEVLTDWKAAKPGNALVYGAVASQGAAIGDGNSLALGRLHRLEQAVGTVTPPIPALVSELLVMVPAALATPGADGIMVLASMQAQQPATITYCAFRATRPDADERIRALLKDNKLDTALSNELVQPLGPIRFAGSSTEVVDDTLSKTAEEWKRLAKVAAIPGVIMVLPKTGAEGTDESRLAQASTACVALSNLTDTPVQGLPASQVETFPVDPMLQGCQAIMIFRITQQQEPDSPRRLGRIVVMGRSPDAPERSLLSADPSMVVSFEADGSLQGGIPQATLDSIKRSLGRQVITDVELAPFENRDSAAARNRLKAVFDSLQSAGFVSTGATVARSTVATGLSADDRKFFTSDNINAKDLIVLVTTMRT